MNRILSIVAALLLSTAIAGAGEDPHAKVPEMVLLDGMVSVFKCVGTDSAGIRSLARIITAEKTEPSANSKQDIFDMTVDSDTLLETGIEYTEMGIGIGKSLMKFHSYKEDDLVRQMNTILTTTHETLLKELNDASNYTEFQEKFTPMLEKCKNEFDDFEKKVVDAVESIDH